MKVYTSIDDINTHVNAPRIMDRLTAYVTVKNTEKRFVYVSPYMVSVFPKFKEYLGKCAADVWENPALLAIIEDGDESALGGSEYFKEVKYTEHGENRDIMVYKTPLYDHEGDIIGILSIGRDITYLRDMERQARHRETLLRAVLDAADDPIFATDPEGKVIMSNDILGGSIEIRAEDMLGTEYFKHFPPGVSEKRRLILDGLCYKPRSVRIQEEHDGTVWEASLSPLVGDEGVELVVVYARNITKQIAREKEVMARQEQLLKIALEGLSKQEYETLRLSIAGVTLKEIARELDTTDSVIQNARARIKQKMHMDFDEFLGEYKPQLVKIMRYMRGGWGGGGAK